MFKRALRFSFSKGSPRQKIVRPLFIVRYQKSDTPSFAIVAGKVVSKKAVERNRVKRIFLLALQEVLNKQKNSNTLVFFLKRPYDEYLKSGIITELEEILKDINRN